MLDAACSWWLGKLLWKEDTRWKWSLFVWWRIRIVYKIWLELSFPGWLENRYYRKCAFITNDTYKQYWKASHFYMEPHQYNRGEKGASFPPHTLVSLFPLISSLIFCPSSQIKSSDISTSFFRLLLFWITWRRSGRWSRLRNDRSRVIWGASPGSPNPMRVLYNGFDAQIIR